MTDQMLDLAAATAADGPRYGQMTITPEKAAALLGERNTSNRRMSATIVTKYARDMASGNWLQNGDPIRFAVDGTLLDGQHRLSAIVKAGVTLRVFVVWNLPRESQDTMDDGRKRTMANVLELDGHSTHSRTTASIVRRAYLYDRGFYSSAGSANPSKQEMKEYLAANPTIWDSAAKAEAMRSGRGVRCAASTLGLAHFLFSRKSQVAADNFFDLLRTGAGLPEKHPVLVLRNRLAVDGSTRVSTESTEVLVWFIKTWNAYRSGASMSIIRYKSNESFPEPK